MKFIPKCGLIVAFALSTQLSIGQSAIVLINEQPTRVKIENGEITAVYEKVPNYMDGYKKAPEDAFKKLPLKAITGSQVYVFEDTPEPAEINTTEDTGETIEVDAVEDSELASAIDFNSGSAILSNIALTTIEDYAKQLKNSEVKSILLKSWYRSGDSNSQELVKNRLEACRAYLESQGVASNVILTSLIGSNRESKFVSVIVN